MIVSGHETNQERYKNSLEYWMGYFQTRPRSFTLGYLDAMTEKRGVIEKILLIIGFRDIKREAAEKVFKESDIYDRL